MVTDSESPWLFSKEFEKFWEGGGFTFPSCRCNHDKISKAICLSAEEEEEACDTLAHRGLHEVTLEYCWPELSKATNNFSKIKAIGTGRFSVVYQGKVDEGVDVAIKVYDSSEGSDGFDEEVRQLSRCHHPNVVILLGFAADGYRNRQALVYEFLPGGSAYTRLHSGDLYLWQDRLKTAIDASRGLAHLHKLRPEIFHRDIKSSCVLFGVGGVAKIADFGFVSIGGCTNRVTGSKETRERSYIASAGHASSAYYSAPELIRTGTATEQSDVYSMGIVLIELLTAQLPSSLTEVGRGFIYLLEHASGGAGDANEIILGLLDPSAKWLASTGAGVGAFARLCIHNELTKRPTFIEMVTLLQQLTNVGLNAEAAMDEMEAEARSAHMLINEARKPPKSIDPSLVDTTQQALDIQSSMEVSVRVVDVSASGNRGVCADSSSPTARAHLNVGQEDWESNSPTSENKGVVEMHAIGQDRLGNRTQVPPRMPDVPPCLRSWEMELQSQPIKAEDVHGVASLSSQAVNLGRATSAPQPSSKVQSAFQGESPNSSQTAALVRVQLQGARENDDADLRFNPRESNAEVAPATVEPPPHDPKLWLPASKQSFSPGLSDLSPVRPPEKQWDRSDEYQLDASAGDTQTETDVDSRSETRGLLKSLFRRGEGGYDPGADSRPKGEAWFQSWRRPAAGSSAPVERKESDSDSEGDGTDESSEEKETEDMPKGWLQSLRWRRGDNSNRTQGSSSRPRGRRNGEAESLIRNDSSSLGAPSFHGTPLGESRDFSSSFAGVSADGIGQVTGNIDHGVKDLPSPDRPPMPKLFHISDCIE